MSVCLPGPFGGAFFGRDCKIYDSHEEWARGERARVLQGTAAPGVTLGAGGGVGESESVPGMRHGPHPTLKRDKEYFDAMPAAGKRSTKWVKGGPKMAKDLRGRWIGTTRKVKWNPQTKQRYYKVNGLRGRFRRPYVFRKYGGARREFKRIWS